MLCRPDNSEHMAHKLTTVVVRREIRYSTPAGTLDNKLEKARLEEEEALAKARYRGVPVKDWWKEKQRVKNKKVKSIEMRNYKPLKEMK